MSVYKKGVSRIAVALASLAMGASSAQAETGQIGYPESWRTPEFLSDWGLGAMKADHAYAQGITGKGVKIGIVDSGVLLNHPDLLGQVTGVTNSGVYFANGFRYGPTNGAYRQGEPYSIPGSFIPGTNDTHGTHVGGSMVASRNGVGMHGVAFGSTLYSSNTGGMDSFISGANADYNLFKGAYGNLVAAGARVINTSWGNAPRYERTTDLAGLTQAYLPMALRRTFMDALEEVSRTGVVLVFAAGNSNLQPDPANHATPLCGLAVLSAGARKRLAGCCRAWAGRQADKLLEPLRYRQMVVRSHARAADQLDLVQRRLRARGWHLDGCAARDRRGRPAAPALSVHDRLASAADLVHDSRQARRRSPDRGPQCRIRMGQGQSAARHAWPRTALWPSGSEFGSRSPGYILK